MSIKSIHPANGDLLEIYDEMEEHQINDIIRETHEAWKIWKNTDFKYRAVHMRKAAEILRTRKEDYAGLMTEEMGKVFKDGVSEIEKCAWVCEFYADNAEKFLVRDYVDTDASNSYVEFCPMGVVLAVMPWNFPFWQVFRFAAPTLMAGNGAVLKHASNVSGCSLAIEGVFADAGFTKDLFRSLIVSSSHVEKIIENPLIQAATLTGSTEAGRSVAAAAGKNLKKAVLELGGSDAYIVLKDANLKSAADTCVQSRLINAGQSCIAAKRFIVVDAVREEFTNLMKERLQKIMVGDPWNESTDMGPMAKVELRDALHRQVVKSIEMGADCLLGGKIPEGDGAFYPPTLLVNVKPGMPAYEEEIFGPVASIIPVKDREEAIEAANHSTFGLGAAVFTSDLDSGERIATYELEAGSCFVNALVKSDPRLPFGGIKNSGFGRELGAYGIKEFVNIKTVYVK